MKEVPVTYANISRKLLHMFLRNEAQFVIVDFDTYPTPSIKDYEHDLRGTHRGRKIEFRGSLTRPSDFFAEMKNITFKEDLVEYLLTSFEHNEMAPLLGNKILYVYFHQCYRYQVVNENVVKTIDYNHTCSDDEEADTKIIYHVCNFKEIEPPFNVVVRCSDTDILVILLNNMKFVHSEVKVWMEVGIGTSFRCINVSDLAETLGPNICGALSAFHAATGCDFSPAFFRKGKKRPYAILTKSDRYINAFTCLSQCQLPADIELDALEEFVCEMYSQKKIVKINEARAFMFLKAYDNLKDERLFLDNIKSFDSSSLPLCQSELHEHFSRSAYISTIWANANLKKPTNLSPLDCGWKLEGNKYAKGDQVPLSIDDVALEEYCSETNLDGKPKMATLEKNGDDCSSSSSGNLFNYGASKKSLGARRNVRSGFVPPVRQEDSNGASRYTPPDGIEAQPAEPLDERLRNIDPKMIELITNEIMHKYTPIDWDDIAGLEYAKATIKEAVVWPLLRPDIFKGLRRPPRGILLFGPPGTGKTLIGKCIASQSRSTFFSISASSLTSKWVGDGEKMVRALFAVAAVNQPAVVFIDEIDSLLSQRSELEHESSRRLKTEFLVQLDGASTSDEERILIVGATNRPQELDEAARRRLVRRLYIPLPETTARIQILTNLLKTVRNNIAKEEILEVGNLTCGYSGADVDTLCREASMEPIRSIPPDEIPFFSEENVRPVQFNDFLLALQRIRASVSEKDLQHYIDWNRIYGAGQ